MTSSELCDRPNILLVFPDQLSARWLGCYGHPLVRTPRIDRFARQGVRFSRAYTCAPLCSPYRASLLTGLYPTQHGVTENGLRLPDHLPTLACSLRAAGYSTHYMGKWHLGGPPGGNHWVPPEKRGGFEHFVGWESHHIDHWEGLLWRDDPDRPIPLRGHETDGLTEIVCDAMEGIEEPFFMAVSYQAPHPPCSPPQECREPYADAPLAEEPNADPEAWFRVPAWGENCGIREFRESYFGEITQLDAAFGRVLDTLGGAGLAGNTAVIFTSDHGEMAGAHGMFGKGVMYDEALRVPLIVQVPGGTGGRALEAPVCSLDLTPTLLRLAGAEPLPGAEGVDLTRVLTGDETPDAGRTVFAEHKHLCAIRGRHKLVAGRDGELHALFDTERDPYELHSLLDDPSRAGVVQRLRERIRQWPAPRR